MTDGNTCTCARHEHTHGCLKFRLLEPHLEGMTSFASGCANGFDRMAEDRIIVLAIECEFAANVRAKSKKYYSS